MSFNLDDHRPELDALIARERAKGGALIPEAFGGFFIAGDLFVLLQFFFILGSLLLFFFGQLGL